MELTELQLIKNYRQVQQNIQDACLRTNRNPQEVQLLAVSKTKPLEEIKVLYEQGQIMFGENYVQELCEKQKASDCPVQWHMIGHLQRNKVKYIVDFVSLIHSVDSVRLAEQIEKEAAKHNRMINILLEINIAKEPSKYGFHEEEILEAVKIISQYPHVHIRGLMTSAPRTDNPEDNRIYFRKMKMLAKTIEALHIPSVSMDTLSMGMTNDYVAAVEEGATMVRVGTALFGERIYSEKVIV